MNENKIRIAIPEIETLRKGKDLCVRLKDYMHLLENDFSNQKLPQRLQEMAKKGLEISTGKNFSAWFKFIEEVESKLTDCELARGEFNSHEFAATLDQWRELSKKFMFFINQVPQRGLDLLRKKQTEEDVDRLFTNNGKPLTQEIINWLNGLLGSSLQESSEKNDGLQASMGSRFMGEGSRWVMEIDSVRKAYGSLEAVKGVSLKIKKGDIFGLLGPNGAGKTTLIECIEGVRQPDGGTIRLFGERFSSQEKEIKEKIGVQLQSFGYYETLTIKEVLKLYAGFFKINRDLDELLSRLELMEKRNTQVKNLSGGQLQRLALATALVNDPELLFLDEPTTGLDPHARRNMWAIIKDLQAAGKTIFLTTHYMEEAEFLCSQVAIMCEGKIITQAAPEQLINEHTQEKTIEVYYTGTIGEEEVEKLPGVNRFWFKDSKLIIASRDYKITLTGLLDWQVVDAGIEDITIRRGNLEDVFLKLTDRGLDR